MSRIKSRLQKLENRNGFRNNEERRKAIKSLRNIDPDIQASDIQSPEDADKLWAEYIPNYFNDQPLTEANEKFLDAMG